MTASDKQQFTLPVAMGATLVMFLWATCFPLIKIGLLDAPPITFAALRAGLSGSVLLMAAFFAGQSNVISGTDRIGIAMVGLTATTIGFLGMFLGGAEISPGLATVVSNMQPLFAAGLAWMVLGERLSILQQLGMAAGFGGIVLIGMPNMELADPRLFGIALLLFAAIGIAISNVLLKRIAGRVEVLAAMGWQLLIGGIPLAIISIYFEDFREIVWSSRFLISLVVLSLVGTSAAFVIWFSLLRRVTLNRLNVFTFLTPIFGLAMGFAFYGESLSAVQVAGILLSATGIHYVCRPTGSVVPVSLPSNTNSDE